jgi:hypothetical protein
MPAEVYLKFLKLLDNELEEYCDACDRDNTESAYRIPWEDMG